MVTIEPGVYVEGVGGIRIEDDALVTPRGAEILTTATKGTSGTLSSKTIKGSKKQPAASEISAQGVDFEQLESLLSFMAEHGLEEFEYSRGDLRIRLRKAATSQGNGARSGGSGGVERACSAVVHQTAARTALAAAAPATPAGAGIRPASAGCCRGRTPHQIADRGHVLPPGAGRKRVRSSASGILSRPARRFALSKR